MTYVASLVEIASRSYDNLVQLEHIQIPSKIKQPDADRTNLFGPLIPLRPSTAQTDGQAGRAGGGRALGQGAQEPVGWVRPGLPVDIKVDLKGLQNCEFLNDLVDFFLSRLRDFQVGGPLAASSASCIVSFGLPPTVLGSSPSRSVRVTAHKRCFRASEFPSRDHRGFSIHICYSLVITHAITQATSTTMYAS
ncbi:hypothetical protein C8Q80DRAFT_1175016 [Daedaleopsis nitida]|nr:hypothetical protein C8Q80DRAFT_1175016 [Daedaleopsis nitida]